MNLSELYILMEDFVRKNYKTVLSMNHVVDILAYLYEHDDVKITDLHCIATNHPALQSAVMKMIGAGLITMEQRELPKTKSTLGLTGLGSEVAAHLHEARRIYLENIGD